MKRSTRGFTLIELMVTVLVLAIIVTIALPNLRPIILRNKVASISIEFTGALQQTRALAISKNSCMSLCASVNVTASNTATCNNQSTDDFQAGWLIFVNAACDAAQTTPTAAGGTLTFVRAGETGGYSIKPSAASMSIVMFDPRGFANLAASGNFQIKTPNDEASYRRTICLDAAGRATVRAYTTACN